MRKIRKGWEIFDFFPPIFVRLLAREKVGKSSVRVLTDQEIAIRGEIAIGIVEHLSGLHNWDTVNLSHARSFCKGCNLDIFDWKVRNAAYALANSGSFAYLKCSPEWQTKYIPLLKKFFDAQKADILN
jgi:hypothetical protein